MAGSRNTEARRPLRHPGTHRTRRGRPACGCGPRQRRCACCPPAACPQWRCRGGGCGDGRAEACERSSRRGSNMAWMGGGAAQASGQASALNHAGTPSHGPLPPTPGASGDRPDVRGALDAAGLGHHHQRLHALLHRQQAARLGDLLDAAQRRQGGLQGTGRRQGSAGVVEQLARGGGGARGKHMQQGRLAQAHACAGPGCASGQGQGHAQVVDVGQRRATPCALRCAVLCALRSPSWPPGGRGTPAPSGPPAQSSP